MFFFAFRNVLRNKRRSIITLISIIFGAYLITSMRFLAYGMHQQSLFAAVNLTTGFVQLAANGWLENKPLERALDVTPQLLTDITASGAKSYSLRLESSALASFGSHSEFVSVLAADPEAEKKITVIHEKPVKGKFLHQLTEPSRRNAAGLTIHRVNIGTVLANNLDVKIGDVISLVTSQFDGSVGAILCEVAGIYRTFDQQLDASRVFLSLPAGEELFGLVSTEGQTRRVTSIALAAPDYLAAEKIHEYLREKYPPPPLPAGENREDSEDYSPVAHFWPELIPGLVQLMEFDDIQNNVSHAFLILIMAFGVLNTVQMSIQERKREFGVLMALGTKQNRLIGLILLETLLLLLPGLLLGSLGGIFTGNWLENHPIRLSPELTEAYSQMGMGDMAIMALVNLRELWIALLSLALPSLAFTLLAGRKIYRINPVEVIATY